MQRIDLALGDMADPEGLRLVLAWPTCTGSPASVSLAKYSTLKLPRSTGSKR